MFVFRSFGITCQNENFRFPQFWQCHQKPFRRQRVKDNLALNFFCSHVFLQGPVWVIKLQSDETVSTAWYQFPDEVPPSLNFLSFFSSVYAYFSFSKW